MGDTISENFNVYFQLQAYGADTETSLLSLTPLCVNSIASRVHDSINFTLRLSHATIYKNSIHFRAWEILWTFTHYLTSCEPVLQTL